MYKVSEMDKPAHDESAPLGKTPAITMKTKKWCFIHNKPIHPRTAFNTQSQKYYPS